MLDKIKGILFVILCLLRISYGILTSRKWNLIIVDLEETEVTRTRYCYRICSGKYILEKHTREHPNLT